MSNETERLEEIKTLALYATEPRVSGSPAGIDAWASVRRLSKDGERWVVETTPETGRKVVNRHGSEAL